MPTDKPSALALKIARQHYGFRADRQLGPDKPGTDGALDLARLVDAEISTLVDALGDIHDLIYLAGHTDAEVIEKMRLRSRTALESAGGV